MATSELKRYLTLTQMSGFGWTLASCESVCNLIGSKLARTCDPVVRSSDYGPRGGQFDSPSRQA